MRTAPARAETPASTSATRNPRSAGSCRCAQSTAKRRTSRSRTILTEFGRDGWGEGGEEFAWWCTEAKEAFSASEPVYKSMEPELRKMLGDAVYEEVVKYLDARIASGSPPMPHPAEVELSLGRTRIRRP